MELYNRIKTLREGLGMSQAELAEKLGYSDRSTIAKIESGKNDIVQSKIRAFADALDTTTAYLMGWTDDPYDYETDPDNRFDGIPSAHLDHLKGVYGDDFEAIWKAWQAVEDDAQHNAIPTNAIPFTPPTGYAPILGSIPAGYPVLTNEEVEGYAAVDYPNPEEYFWLRVRGDSMINAGIETGDLVLIRKQPCADDGQIVACRVNGDEATLKRFSRQGDTILLLPENPKFIPQIVKASEFESGFASVIGVAVEVKRNLL